MRDTRLQSTAMLLSLFCATAAYAQSPQSTATVPKLVRFSGSRPATGQPSQSPAPSTESVTLSVYRDQTGGTALWQEVQNVAVDADGSYSRLMGATQNDGMPLDLFNSGEPRWLGARFNRPGETEQPRVLLVSVPYALKASDAETLGGRPASAYLLARAPEESSTAGVTGVTGVTGITATAPSTNKALKPKGTPANSGQPNYIGKFTNTTDLIDSSMYEAGGNVGISTAAPLISLDVRTGSLPQMGIAGTTDYLTFFASDVFGPAIYWDPGKDMRFGRGGASLYNPFGFVEQMRIQSSTGNVGIGTMTPGSKLEVDSASTSASAISGISTATSGQVAGVFGQTTNASGVGVGGINNATSGFAAGVYAQSSSTGGSGVFGTATATSGNTQGVFGQSASPNGNGVLGSNTATSGYAVGVTGFTASPGGAGLNGFSNAASGGFGVVGASPVSGTAVFGVNQTCSNNVCTPVAGTAGLFKTGAGGTVLSGFGGTTPVFHVDASGNGFFAGNLNVTGALSKGSGSFKIDHPLDPANKYLSHSFVESPDMMDVYNGLAKLDAKGEAWVNLPEYFEALNGDFRYQLTAVGAPAPRLYVAKEVSQNRFKIAGGRPGGRVSWQVTGIRHDAYANAHRIPVTEDKPSTEQGRYLHPDVFGQGEGRQIGAGH